MLAETRFGRLLLAYLKNHGHEPNRGPHRHFLPMSFELPCFVPEFFFDNQVLNIARSVMDDTAVADQWGCDVPLRGSDYKPFMLTIRVRYSPKLQTSRCPLAFWSSTLGWPRLRLNMVPSKLRPVHTGCRGRKRFGRGKPLKLECSQSRWRSVMCSFGILGRCTEAHRIPPTHLVPLFVSVMCVAGM